MVSNKTIPVKVKYGIWNSCRKEFQFGICEDSKSKAYKRLFEKIGKDAYKWRFTVKPLPIKEAKNGTSS